MSSDQHGSKRSPTPLSITSSSSEEDICGQHSPFRSYDIISSRVAATSSPKQPPSKKTSTSSSVTIPKIDPSAVADLERQAEHAARSLSKMTQEFTLGLGEMADRTAEFTTLYETGINELHGTVDANVKTMYSLIAKAEELNRSMTPVYELGHQIQDIKQMLDTLETMCR